MSDSDEKVPAMIVGGSSRGRKVKKPKLLFGLIAVLIIVGLLAALYVVNRQSEQQRLEEAMQITITEDGFLPTTARVYSGTTVIWTNEDTASHWVASNPHPTHDDLPDLDTGDSIGPESTYSFTFDDAGTYDYHDHLNPEFNGTIVVVDRE